MPAAPPAIYTPPSAGAPPSAAGAVFVPPSAGSPPAAAGAVFEPAPAGKSVLVISGAVTAGVNGSVVYCGLINSKPAWSRDGTQSTSNPANVLVFSGIGSPNWIVQIGNGTSYYAAKSSSAATPDGLTAWTVSPGSGSPVIAAFAVPTPPAITT
jgi:hypothetical protein